MGTIIGVVFLCLGIFVFLTEIIGLFKFKYVMNRMHAAALGDTLGLIFSVVGIILLRGWSFAAFKLILIPVFMCFTSPVITHLIAKVEIESHNNKNHEYKEEEH